MGWFNELRVSLRSLRAMPGVAAVIVASLAIGIGVNTTVFSWIQSRVLDPLPGVAHAGGRACCLSSMSSITATMKSEVA